jgi:hypothetical protein
VAREYVATLLMLPTAKIRHVQFFSDWLRGRTREKSANGVTDEGGQLKLVRRRIFQSRVGVEPLKLFIPGGINLRVTLPIVNITLRVHQLHGEFIPSLPRIYVL